ncbi:MAG: DNA starvation/stationary phase protection protein [Vicingaceae bacterium]|jgi:starvation-inducible DNA-binding protein|nr:DNA starvation/stationary phase protection protein [Flavobacteriales bacterium]MBL1233893.1 DNA starvation/stationary phase protection protein [Flavobacteriales bacterium]MBQ21438.1 DNA starvation/stationary phase protection protein [Flavobacteriales bacterium]MDF1674800.1 DNA starvation/stationary phase protection protein [Vicingaceae bacterium]|tara:strand:- start:118929 stop:119396 length:468 start_codon:yes stop_codon:yes gene_type:complete
MKNLIGLDKEKTLVLRDKLNDLLADYQLFYQNLRGLHWNIKGKEFFELHVKFEEFYNDAIIKIDEIAERILTLEGEPLHTYSAYLKASEIKEEKSVTDGVKGVEIIIKNFGVLILKEREILSLASDANDEGTVSLMSDYITQTEKTLWMLNAYLK